MTHAISGGHLRAEDAGTGAGTGDHAALVIHLAHFLHQQRRAAIGIEQRAGDTRLIATDKPHCAGLAQWLDHGSIVHGCLVVALVDADDADAFGRDAQGHQLAHKALARTVATAGGWHDHDARLFLATGQFDELGVHRRVARAQHARRRPINDLPPGLQSLHRKGSGRPPPRVGSAAFSFLLLCYENSCEPVFRSRQRLPAAGKTPRQSWLFGCEFKFSQSRFVKFYIPARNHLQAPCSDLRTPFVA